MAANKIVVNDETIIDLTADSVTPETLLQGATAHDASGAAIVGSLVLSAVKKFSSTNPTITGSGGMCTWTISQETHGIATPCVVQVYEESSGNMVTADVSVSTTMITISINAASLAAGVYRVVVIG